MLFNLIDEDAAPKDASEKNQQPAGLGLSLQDQLKQLPLVHLPLDKVIPDPEQPRKSFDDESLLDLAQSIEENGLLQPIVVQPEDESGSHRIIMGERRWRAHEFAGKTSIPAIIRPASDSTVLALQIIENNQREDIAPLEEARALQRLVDVTGNKKEVAQALGRSPSWLSKRLSLLKAPRIVQAFADQQDVKDINTLNSLSKLYDEYPTEAEALMADITENGTEGGLRSRVEQKRQEMQTAAPVDETQDLPVPSNEAPSELQTDSALPDKAGSSSNQSGPTEKPLDRQSFLRQQLKLSPLSTLEGIEKLNISFAEVEQSFRRYLLTADLSRELPQQWKDFLSTLSD